MWGLSARTYVHTLARAAHKQMSAHCFAQGLPSAGSGWAAALVQRPYLPLGYGVAFDLAVGVIGVVPALFTSEAIGVELRLTERS